MSTSLNEYFTEWVLHWMSTSLNEYFTEWVFHWMSTSLNEYFTEWLLHWMSTSLGENFTEWVLHWISTSLNEYFTEWVLHWMNTSLNEYFTEWVLAKPYAVRSEKYPSLSRVARILWSFFYNNLTLNLFFCMLTFPSSIFVLTVSNKDISFKMTNHNFTPDLILIAFRQKRFEYPQKVFRRDFGCVWIANFLFMTVSWGLFVKQKTQKCYHTLKCLDTYFHLLF